MGESMSHWFNSYQENQWLGTLPTNHVASGYVFSGMREQKTISADGSTVVEIEYSLASFDVAFSWNAEDEGVESIEFVYETTARSGELADYVIATSTQTVANGGKVSVEYTATMKVKVVTKENKTQSNNDELIK